MRTSGWTVRRLALAGALGFVALLFVVVFVWVVVRWTAERLALVAG